MRTFKVLPQPVSVLFLLIGLFSATCFRVIIIVQHFHADYIRLFWYMAVIANMIFFLFRYYISLKRKHAVQDLKLIRKLQNDVPLNSDDKTAMLYLLTSIDRSQENLNYLSIFAFSILAVIVDLILSVR